MDAFLAGVVAGYGIAIPVGAIAAYLVALTARTSFRVGGAAALGVATADGLYAAAAVLGGAALSGIISPIATPLRWTSFAVLVVLAAGIGIGSVAEFRHPRGPRDGTSLVRSAGRAYSGLLGATLVNPTTVVYFAALVVGRGGDLDGGPVAGAVFVLGAFLASASWQLLLAGGGAALGRVLTGPRGRLATGLVSAALVGALAVWTLLSG